MIRHYILLVLLLPVLNANAAKVLDSLEYTDLFKLEFVSDPQISPAGDQVVYVRNSFDLNNDRKVTDLWRINSDGSDHRPLIAAEGNQFSPRWSPDGKRLLYLSNEGGKVQLYIYWLDTRESVQISNHPSSPSGPVWSPDGTQIVFSSFVEKPGKESKLDHLKPSGATWSTPPVYVDRLLYKANGVGLLKDGSTHLFVIPSEGGSAAQITDGIQSYSPGFGLPSWSPAGDKIVFSANRDVDWERDQFDVEVFEVDLKDRSLKQLTDQKGPDASPKYSPDGKYITYTSFEDRVVGYQNSLLHLMNADGSAKRILTENLDRDVQSTTWHQSGKSVFFRYLDRGEVKVGSVTLNGEIITFPIALDFGVQLGRPYSGGNYSVSDKGDLAFTIANVNRPPELAVLKAGKKAPQTLTGVNDDLFNYKLSGALEEISLNSSHDGQPLQGWLMKPPGFDPSRQYPLILEIHGGPFSNYGGERFAAEFQFYAQSGYVVLFINPRGSIGYGEEFANLIHHDYPGNDYDDLMSAVDHVIDLGFIDENNLFVTGGSAGGTMTAWIIGKTDRFNAAVVAKPTVNFITSVLVADGGPYWTRYWFPGNPWEHVDHYVSKSALFNVGKVNTPTLLMGGEQDWRTPISEAEQFYMALKLQGKEAAMVRFPDAPHNIAARPSYLIAKIAYILEWFDRYRK